MIFMIDLIMHISSSLNSKLNARIKLYVGHCYNNISDTMDKLDYKITSFIL